MCKILIAEIMEFRAVAQHVVDVGEHGGCDSDNRFLGTAAGLEPEKLGLEVAVLFAGGGPGDLGSNTPFR